MTGSGASLARDYLLWSRLKLTKYWPLSLKRICIGSCSLVTASAPGCCLARPRLPLLRSGSDCIWAAAVTAAMAGAGAGHTGCRLWLPLTIFISPATRLGVKEGHLLTCLVPGPWHWMDCLLVVICVNVKLNFCITEERWKCNQMLDNWSITAER